MNADNMHPTPSRAAVLREQFRAVGLVQRRQLLLLAAVVIGLVLLAIYGLLQFEETLSTIPDPEAVAQEITVTLSEFLGGLTLPALLLGLIWPSSVWKDEGPSRRRYHWAMPVDRTVHTLMKSLAGWGWLMIAGLGSLVILVGVLAAAGFLSGADETAVWRWAVPFTAATVFYLWGSVAAILTDHPARWIFGVFIAHSLLVPVLTVVGLPDLAGLLESIIDGRYGLETVVTGEATTEQPPDFGLWLTATALWLAVGSAGVVFAASRHLEG